LAAVVDSTPEDEMLGAIGQGLSGITAGMDRLNAAAGRIARDGADGDLSGNMVALIRASEDVRMNVAVVRKANEMLGSLLDVWA
jgi:hypothetical protein